MIEQKPDGSIVFVTTEAEANQRYRRAMLRWGWEWIKVKALRFYCWR